MVRVKGSRFHVAALSKLDLEVAINSYSYGIRK